MVLFCAFIWHILHRLLYLSCSGLLALLVASSSLSCVVSFLMTVMLALISSVFLLICCSSVTSYNLLPVLKPSAREHGRADRFVCPALGFQCRYSMWKGRDLPKHSHTTQNITAKSKLGFHLSTPLRLSWSCTRNLLY